MELFTRVGQIFTGIRQVHGVKDPAIVSKESLYESRRQLNLLAAWSCDKRLGRAVRIEARQSGFRYSVDGRSCGIICMNAAFLH